MSTKLWMHTASTWFCYVPLDHVHHMMTRSRSTHLQGLPPLTMQLFRKSARLRTSVSFFFFFYPSLLSHAKGSYSYAVTLSLYFELECPSPPPICGIFLSCSVLVSANIVFPPTYPFRVKCLLSMLGKAVYFRQPDKRH